MRKKGLKTQWKELVFVSIEHLVIAFADDSRFGTKLLRDMVVLKNAESPVKEIRGTASLGT
jgi:hypothetical protein